MSTVDATEREQLTNTIQDTWRLLMGVGVVLTLVGLLAIVTPFFTGITLSFLFGVYLIVGAVAHLVHAFSGRGWTGFVFQLILAILFAVGGLAFLFNPLVGLTALTILLIAFFLVEGFTELAMGFRLRPERGWLWVAVSGVASVLVAVLVWLSFPSSAAWAVGLLFGIGLFTSGLSMIATAMGGRAAVKEATATSGTETGG